MALTEETIEDKIEIVTDFKKIQVRTATVIKRDGDEISRTFHRHLLSPCTKSFGTWEDTDISKESTEVQGIANVVWTDTVKNAYKTYCDAREI